MNEATKARLAEIGLQFGELMGIDIAEQERHAKRNAELKVGFYKLYDEMVALKKQAEEHVA